MQHFQKKYKYINFTYGEIHAWKISTKIEKNVRQQFSRT